MFSVSVCLIRVNLYGENTFRSQYAANDQLSTLGGNVAVLEQIKRCLQMLNNFP